MDLTSSLGAGLSGERATHNIHLWLKISTRYLEHKDRHKNLVGAAASHAFREVVHEVSPKAHKLFTQKFRKKTSYNPKAVFTHLFPFAKCVYCLEPLGVGSRLILTGRLLKPEILTCSRKCRCLLDHGVENIAQVPEIRAKMLQTMHQRYRVGNASQSAEIKERKRVTCRRNYGVDNPQQCKEIFEKTQRARYKISEYTYQNRAFEVQSSYERVVFEILADHYGIENVITQFDPEFPDYIWEEAGTFPDLYVTSRDLFIEVKSGYTLLSSLKDNRRKAKNLVQSGNKCRWVVLLKPRTREYVCLPKLWFTLSTPKLRKLLQMSET